MTACGLGSNFRLCKHTAFVNMYSSSQNLWLSKMGMSKWRRVGKNVHEWCFVKEALLHWQHRTSTTSSRVSDFWNRANELKSFHQRSVFLCHLTMTSYLALLIPYIRNKCLHYQELIIMRSWQYEESWMYSIHKICEPCWSSAFMTWIDSNNCNRHKW